jgi:hypothetical protein
MSDYLDASERRSEFHLLINNELSRIGSMQVNHTTVDGDLHEDITKDYFDANIAEIIKQGVRSVSGFISIDGVTIGPLIDCMVVIGEGVELSRRGGRWHTYDLKQILAIGEVKKSMTSSSLAESLVRIKTVKDLLLSEFLKKPYSVNDYKSSAKAFHYTAAKNIVTDDLTRSEFQYLNSLIFEEFCPVMFVDCFHCIKGFDVVNSLKNRINKAHQGISMPYHIPTVISWNDGVIIKKDGMPFRGDGKITLGYAPLGRFDAVIEMIIWKLISKIDVVVKTKNFISPNEYVDFLTFDLADGKFKDICSLPNAENQSITQSAVSEESVQVLIYTAKCGGELKIKRCADMLLSKGLKRNLYEIFDGLMSSQTVEFSAETINLSKMKDTFIFRKNQDFYATTNDHVRGFFKGNGFTEIIKLSYLKKDNLFSIHNLVDDPAFFGE